MKCLFIFFLLLQSSALIAQRPAALTEEQKITIESNNYRNFTNTPPYGLHHVMQLTSKAWPADSSEEAIMAAYSARLTAALEKQVYNSLTLREKFTYNMLFHERYAQICSMRFAIENIQLKIMAQLPDPFGEFQWSERQEKFFRDNRDSVMLLIKESSIQSKRVGANYKQVLVDINAVEMIPFLIEQYNTDRKDHDILTVLLLLMKENKFRPFLNAPEYETLYGKETDYRSFLIFNALNEQRILVAATYFYNESKK